MLSRPQPVPHGEVPASPKVVKNCCTAVLNSDAPAGSASRPRRSTRSDPRQRLFCKGRQRGDPAERTRNHPSARDRPVVVEVETDDLHPTGAPARGDRARARLACATLPLDTNQTA